jgi:hypothetical protein
MLKRVSGIDFKVEIALRRPGDPAQIVAASDRARARLSGHHNMMISPPLSLTLSPGSKNCDDTRSSTDDGGSV